MPSRDYSEVVGMAMSVSGEWLVGRVRDVLLVDCRPVPEFQQGRLSGAINVTVPASILMLRRLAHGKVTIPSVIKDPESRRKFTESCNAQRTLVLYDADTEEIRPLSHCVLSTLFRRLQQDGCQVLCLQGGYSRFSSEFPEWCESEPVPSPPSLLPAVVVVSGDEESPPHGSQLVRSGPQPQQQQQLVLGLESLRISSSSEPESSSSDSGESGGRCDSGLPLDSDPPFPVEILPHLFLGNAENAGDLEALERHRISYVLNVTPNLPNTFEGQTQLGFKYMQIPIQDHWSQNLASFFPEAIGFIDEARQKQQGVLVHCLAGISRSVTVTLAYIMYKLRMPLNDAYDLVRRRKTNISPNFNFMGQLMDFERQLHLTPCCPHEQCRCCPKGGAAGLMHFTSPTRTTPDSGIDMDRWPE